MNDQEIINKLQTIVRTVLGREEIVLDRKTKFEDLNVNSFSLVQLICAVEDEFGIEIPNLTVRTIRSVPAAVKVIRKCLKNKNGVGGTYE